MNKTPFSSIIAGTMSWGTWGRDCNTKQMIELITCCTENEITTFDLADIYGDYTTEASFGKAFAESKLNRNSIQLISKCGIQIPLKNRNTTVKHYDFSAAYIIHSVEQSLKNLRTDYLDLLLLHRPSPLMKASEIGEAVEKLKNDRKILDFGVSNFTALQMDLVETTTRIHYNQIEFSITHCEAMFNGSLDHMQSHDIVPMCWSPLGTVFKSDTEQSRRVKKMTAKLSLQYGVPEDIILLAWTLKHPSGILPVCGTADTARLAGLMKATLIDMELQHWFGLLSESLGHEVP